MVRPTDALADRTDEESRQNLARAHRELILNYFRAGKEFSSGIIEGLNNKAKVTMRKRRVLEVVCALLRIETRVLPAMASYPGS
jgi:hypothetical protein